MKTSMKNRIVSAVLALAMLASFLPANWFPAALAAGDGTVESIRIYKNVASPTGWSYTVTISGLGSDGAEIPTYNLAIVPNVGDAANFTPFIQTNDIINVDSFPSSSAFEGALNNGTDSNGLGVPAAASTYERNTKTGDDRLYATINGKSGSLTFTGNMSVDLLNAIKASAGKTNAEGSLVTAGDSGIEMCAMLWRQGYPLVSGVYDWQGKNPARLVVTNVDGTRNGPVTVMTTRTDTIPINDLHNMFRAVPLTLENVGGETAVITSTTVAKTGGENGVGAYWKLFYLDSGTYKPLHNGGLEIEPGKKADVYVQRIVFLSATTPATSGQVVARNKNANGTIDIKYDSYDGSNYETVNDIPQLTWSFSRGGYTGTSVTLKIKKWADVDDPANTASVNIVYSGEDSFPITGAYFGSGGNADATISGFTEGGEVSILSTDTTEKAITGKNSAQDLTVKVKAVSSATVGSITKPLTIVYGTGGTVVVNVTIEVEPVTINDTITAYKDGDVWDTGTPSITVRKSGSATDIDPTASADGVFTFNLEPGTYNICADGEPTGLTMNKVGGTAATADVEYFTYKLTASPAAGGTVSDDTAPSIDGVYLKGTDINPAYTAAPGYTFKGWTGTHTSAPKSLEERTVMTANFEISGIKWKDQPNTQTITYGDTISAKKWTAVPDDLVNGKLPITYEVTDWGGLQNYLDEANVDTTSVTSGTPNGGLTLTNKSGQVIPKGTYTIKVKASNGVAADITSQVVITVNPKPLPKPTIAIEGNATIPAGSSIGAVKHTNANNSDYTDAGVTFELLNAAGTTVGKYNGTTFVYSGLSAGIYHVKGTLTDPNYTWNGTNGNISDTVEIKYAGVTQPTLPGTNTFEKNNVVTPYPASVDYTFSTGSWTGIKSVQIDGTTLTAGTHYTISGTTLSILPAAMTGLGNGAHNVRAVFTDSNGYQSDTDAIGTATLNVQTTYVVSFKDSDGTTALSPAHSNLTQVVTSGTPSFAYSASVAAGVGGVPTKTGYTFAGWKKTVPTALTDKPDWASASVTTYDPSGGDTSDDTTAQWNTTVYAVWEPVKYTVTFNGNAASGQSVSGVPSAISNVPYNTTITEPTTAPTSAGYTFGGWYTERGCTNAWDFSSDKVTGDMTLYAKWTVHNYTVNYDLNGHGSGTAPSGHSLTGANRNFTTAAAITDTTGWTFTGWNTLPGGGGVSVNASTATNIVAVHGGSLPADGTIITLYAQWREDTYTVNYNANGHGTAPSTTHTLTAASPTFTAEGAITGVTGYTFTGWNTRSDGKGVSVAAGATGNIITLNGTLPAHGTTITLYAQWTMNTYTVTFNDNPKTGQTITTASNPTSRTVNHGAKTTAPTAPTSAGYKFDGWYKEASCTTAWNFGSDTVTSDITLYAKWLENTITVTANKNGAAENGKTFVLVGGDNSVISGTKSGNVTTFHAVPAGTTYTIHEGDATTHETTGYPAQSVTVGGNTPVTLHYYQVNVVAPVKVEDTSEPVTGGSSYIIATGTTTAELLYNSSTKGSAVIGASETDPDYVFSRWVDAPANGGTEPTQEAGGRYTLTANNTTIKGPITLTPQYSKNTAAMTITVTKDGKPVNEAEVFLDGTSKGKTNASGVLRITGLAAKTYAVTTDVGTGQRAVTITGTTDTQDSLNYFTVRAVASSPSAKDPYVLVNSDSTGTVAEQVVLEAKSGNSNNVAKVVASPNDGYKTPASWSISTTTYQADGTANAPTTSSGSNSPYTVSVTGTIVATASFDPVQITLGDGAGSVTWGNTISSLTKVPAVGYETGHTFASDTPTYWVKEDDGSWGTENTKNGIKLERNAAGGWTVSGTPTSATTTSVTFDIKVISANGTEAENRVVVTISKAVLNRVDVTDIKTPTPGTDPSTVDTADLPTPDPYYGDDTDRGFGDEGATVTWKDKDGNPVTGDFKYGEPYTAEVIVKPDDNHVFADSVTTSATPTENPPYAPKTETVTKNPDGTVTVTYTFPAVYQLVYSPNGGTGGTQPAAQNVKLNDTITIAGDPNYTRPSYEGHHGWATTSGGAVAYTFGQTNVSITQTMLNTAVNGVITLYYRWQSGEMSMDEVALDAVYGMNATQWTSGTVTYQGRQYLGLVAPGQITMSGNSLDLSALTYTLTATNAARFDPNTYFTVSKDATTNVASLVMKPGVTIPNVTGTNPYSFTVTARDGTTGVEASATFTLAVRPIEIDHVALAAVTAPVQGANPVTTVAKTDTDTTWQGFYNTSGVSVSWSPNDKPYKKGQSYTATITLTPKDTNYIFVRPDDKSTTGSVYAVGTDTVIDDTATNPLGNWSHTLSTTQVVLTRTFPMTDISTTATLTAPAWNQLTISGFTAESQKNVNMYYLIYDAPQTFADAAAVRAAYAGATVGTGGVVAMGTQANVVPNASGTATYPGQPITVTNGVVGDHTYYLYVVAEAVDDTTKLATADDDATTYKKLTVAVNNYGQAAWTGNGGSPATASANNKVLSMMVDNTSGKFTASQNNTQFGFVEWRLTPSGGTTANAGDAAEYTYVNTARANDDTLTAIFHRKINGSFTIGITDGSGGSKVYTPSYANSVRIGSAAQAAGALPADSTTSATSGVSYQWYENSGGTWEPISGATSLVYTNLSGAYPGAAFRLVISYEDPDDDTKYTGTGHKDLTSQVEAATDVQVQKLATPAPVLSKVERDVTTTFTDQNGDPVNNNNGGLHLAFPAQDQDNGAGNNTPVDYYDVTLTGNGKTLTAKITADGRTGDYYYYWPASLADVLPGHSFTVSVKAISKGDNGTDAAANGWKNSDPGTATADAGYKTLYMNQLTGTFKDVVFNGSAQTGGKITAPTGAGAVAVTYAPTVGGTRAANQTSVNLAENTSPAPSDGSTDSEHDYYIYVHVAQGTLYLALDGQFEAASTSTVNAEHATANGNINTSRTSPHADWEIVQAKAEMTTIAPPTGKETGETVDVLNGKLPQTYYGDETAAGKYKTASSGKYYTTEYYDIKYYLRSITDASGNDVTDPVWTAKIGSEIPLTGTVGESMQSFTPNVGANYNFEAVATYKDNTDDQFRADVSEVSQTFTYAIGVRTIDKIDLLRHEAWNGTTGVDRKDASNNSIDPTWNANRAVTYGNSEEGTGLLGFYDAGDATAIKPNEAKQMRLEGLKVYITYSNKTHSEHVLQADGTWDVPLPAGYTYNWNSSNAGTAAAPAITDQYMTFKGAGVTTGLSITSTATAGGKTTKSNDVTYTMAKRPLPYTIEATNTAAGTATEDIDWTVKAEKLWNNDTTLYPDRDKARDGRLLKLRNVVVDAFAVADGVGIDAHGYESRKKDDVKTGDSTVGKDRQVVAKNAQPSGGYAAFYRTGTATNDTIDIYPARVTKLAMTLNAPSTNTNNDENKVANGRYAPNTNDRTDETGVKHNNNTVWELPVVSTTWEVWTGDDADGKAMWEPVSNTSYFAIDKVYRATVIVEADTNHYMSKDEIDNYTLNGKKNGEKPIVDLDDWNGRDENVVTVKVDQSKPFHEDWKPDDEVAGEKILFHNRTTFTYVFHTYLTPSLQFSDEKGAFTAPGIGTHHERNNYVHHTEIVNKGAGEITYTISVNASVKDIFGAQVIMTNKELTNAGATLTVKQGNGDADTATPVTDRVYHDAATSKDYNKMYKYAEALPYEADKDLIIYELKIPSSVTANPGIYHLELQAMGSTSIENWRADKVDVAKSYYTFTLEVLDDRPTGGGGTTTIETPIVQYMVTSYGYTSDLTSEKMPRVGAKPTFTPKITPMAGLRFLGWSETDPTKLEPGKLPTLVDPLTFTIDEDKIFYAVYEWVGHSHYVIGFPDGTFGPDNPITRGQVATIIARACLEGFVEGSDYGNPGNYSDVGSHWAASAIAYCSLRGVFAGYEDGTFRPDRYISRQELATVVARLAGVQANQGLTFTDSGDVASWALNGVYTNVSNGWVNGYEDNTFRPLQNITRAETVKIFNGYLGRGVDAKGLEGLTEYVHSGVASNTSGSGEENKEYMTWPDVAKSHWAYFEVIEAANDHDYHWQDNTKATPPEQWDAAYIDETWRYYDNENDGGQNVGLEAKTFTVTYMIPDAEPVSETVKIYESPTVELLLQVQSQLTVPEGFYLVGWTLKDPSANEITEEDLVRPDPTAYWVEEDRTYYPVFQPIPEYVMPDVVVTYDIGLHGTTTAALTETVKMYESPSATGLPKITPEAGYRLWGWTRKDPAANEITREDLEDPTASPVLEDTTFYAVYVDKDGHVLPTVVVTYVIGENGTTASATTELVEMYESPTPDAMPVVVANEGWKFQGWSETDPATGTVTPVDPTASYVTADKTFYAVYEPAQPGETEPPVETEPPAETEPPVETQLPEETQPPEQVTVTYLVSSNGVTYDSISETLSWGTAPAAETLPIAVPNPGYRFAGWSATDPSAGEISLVDPTVTAITEDRNFYAVFQPEEVIAPEETPQPPVDYDRTSYINGFGEGEFRPNEAITRAAVASIIANLNGYDAGQQYGEADGYADLEGHWAKNVIAFCIQKGLLSGYEDGTFRPDRSISRQEFAVVISRMAGIQSNEGLSFTDVDTIAPWALDGVYTAYVNGWIGGYEDGTFLPEKSITRAEAVKVFNAYLGRSANPAAIQAASGYTVWNDVADTHWAYYEIIEASNNWEEPLPASEEGEEPQPPEETAPVEEGDPSQLPNGEEVKPVDSGETVNPSDEEDTEPDQSGDAGPEPEPTPGEGEAE